ncbi:NUDIX hydrolase [Halobacillus sp. Nhm2S1]|uniref:NUDIX hydrolase n=1 Tax=Halobacillus sp. Nhm2S1 TaxID=2866716 RepID=UPI001C735DFC|nr:NUDIX hydrolase [Halobacillus sp. Nhm2S1]MBX0358467.1 NUDIX hydrolase [Halobacillus sp. Nhm2S1]
MNTEMLKVFNKEKEQMGVASRDVVHAKGLWHETFHCWFLSQEANQYYIHFQLRSKKKKDYPNMLDISAAGHINANERVCDGIREVHEELGVNVTYSDLISLGTIPDEIIQDNFIDRELGHVFLYIIPNIRDIIYNFEVEEVSGVFKIRLEEFERLWFKETKSVLTKGIVLDKELRHVEEERLVSKGDFLPHANDYISKVIKALKNKL